MDQDCYFIIDPRPEVSDEDRTMLAVCIKHHNELYPDSGWFWEGSKMGYGPWEFRCFVCNELLHDPSDDEMVEVDDDIARRLNDAEE